jgi:hypothetical protein
MEVMVAFQFLGQKPAQSATACGGLYLRHFATLLRFDTSFTMALLPLILSVFSRLQPSVLSPQVLSLRLQ